MRNNVYLAAYLTKTAAPMRFGRKLISSLEGMLRGGHTAEQLAHTVGDTAEHARAGLSKARASAGRSLGSMGKRTVGKAEAGVRRRSLQEAQAAMGSRQFRPSSPHTIDIPGLTPGVQGGGFAPGDIMRSSAVPSASVRSAGGFAPGQLVHGNQASLRQAVEDAGPHLGFRPTKPGIDF